MNDRRTGSGLMLIGAALLATMAGVLIEMGFLFRLLAVLLMAAGFLIAVRGRDVLVARQTEPVGVVAPGSPPIPGQHIFDSVVWSPPNPPTLVPGAEPEVLAAEPKGLNADPQAPDADPEIIVAHVGEFVSKMRILTVEMVPCPSGMTSHDRAHSDEDTIDDQRA